MKKLLSLIVSILTLLNICYSQTPNPYVEEFDSFGGVGEWSLITGQPNTGSHGGDLCYNLVGTYLDDNYYSFESDTLDLSLWSQVNIEFTIASSLRNGDLFAFYYYDSSDSQWYGYNLSGLVGTYNLTIPVTAILLSFDLNTNSNGNVNGKYAHVEMISLTDPATPLPIELLSFTVKNKEDVNFLEWITASEINCDYYNIEWSYDGYSWWLLGDVVSEGTTTEVTSYNFIHEDFVDGINYYRLSQYDFDGKYEIFKTISIDNTVTSSRIVKYVNIRGQEINIENYKGLAIGIYEDGKHSKIYFE